MGLSDKVAVAMIAIDETTIAEIEATVLKFRQFLK